MKQTLLKNAVRAQLVGWLAVLAVFAQGPPEKAQVEQKARWMKEQSNWGRWGKDDELGTLNLITVAKRQQAMALAKTGTVVSLSRKIALNKRAAEVDAKGQLIATDVDEIRFRRDGVPMPGQPQPPGMEGNVEIQTLAYHGIAYTHLDALCHIGSNGKLFNGYPHAPTVDPEKGCLKMGVQLLKDGIVTRGILIDWPRLKGVSKLPPSARLLPADVEAWERQANVKISAGDAVFLRSGWKEGEPGARADYDPSMVAFFRARGVTLISAEHPAGDHELFLNTLGAYLIDNCDLGPLSETSARLNRWEFLLVVAPIPMPGATGSLVNPLALF